MAIFYCGKQKDSSVRFSIGVTLVVSMLAGCANPFFDVGRTETVLPLSRAWVNGQVVEYVTTDISDPAMAQMAGANYVPRLADSLRAGPGDSVLERVYKFPGNEQISVFQSGPVPVGAGNTDRSYSPLWRVVMVRWRDPARVRELKSEEALLSAEEKGEVTLEVTRIVVNCPITRAGPGEILRGVR